MYRKEPTTSTPKSFTIISPPELKEHGYLKVFDVKQNDYPVDFESSLDA